MECGGGGVAVVLCGWTFIGPRPEVDKGDGCAGAVDTLVSVNKWINEYKQWPLHANLRNRRNCRYQKLDIWRTKWVTTLTWSVCLLSYNFGDIDLKFGGYTPYRPGICCVVFGSARTRCSDVIVDYMNDTCLVWLSMFFEMLNWMGK